MAIKFNFFRRGRERLKSQLIKEISEQLSVSPSTYLQGYSESDSTQGRPQRVSYRTLKQLYCKESWVRAAIDVIARTATSNGWKLVPEDEDADLSSIKNSKIKGLVRLLKHPNNEDTFTDIVSEIIIDLHLYGDAYLEIVEQDGIPVGLFNIDASSIKIAVDEHGQVLKYLQSAGWGKKPVELEPQEVIHFKLHNPGNEIYGLSPLESLFIPIETDLYAQSYNKNFFKNDATPRLHIDLGNCNINQLKRVREYLKQQFQGASNAHRTIVTEGGAKISPIGTPPKDMEFLQQRKFNRDEILAVMGVPPIKVGITEGTNRASSKEQDKSFKSEKIIPLQKMITDKLNRGLVSLFKVPVKLAFVEIDLRDATEQSKIDHLKLRDGIITINELRRKYGLKPVSWGDIPIIATSDAPLEGVGKEKGKKKKKK